jgi:hypothetical protein
MALVAVMGQASPGYLRWRMKKTEKVRNDGSHLRTGESLG